MSKKEIVHQIENVRILKNDELNYAIEREETYYNAKDKKDVTRWRFKGWSGSFLGSLRLIHNKELLIDEKAISDLRRHLEQVEKSNGLLLEALEGAS